MKLATFKREGRAGWGVVVADGIADTGTALAGALCRDYRAVLAAERAGRGRGRR